MNTPDGGHASPSGQRKKLPLKPSLEHLQKQAKRRAKQNSALKLAEAQHQLAHEYGCKNWPALAHMVEVMSRRLDQLDQEERYEPMPKAARARDIEQVRRILHDGQFTQHDLDQSLAHALWYGDDSTWPERKVLADLLLDHGADPDGQYGSGGYGPLVFGTCECLQPSGLQYLIDAGADVAFAPIDTKYGKQCPMSHVGTYVRGRNARKHQVIDILLRHGAYVPPEMEPPIMAIHRGDAKMLGELLDRDHDLLARHFPDMPYGNMSLHGATLLHCAVEFGEIECIEELLKHYADINIKADIFDGVGGQTPIFHAINTNGDDNFYTLEYLLKRMGQHMDMSVRATWRYGDDFQRTPMTPLEYAEYAAKTVNPKWRKKTSEELAILRDLDKGSQINAAILAGDISTVGNLLDAHPKLLTPALWPVAIFQAKSLPVTKLLLERGLNPDECSAPRKPLHLAVYQCLPDIIELLIAHGADVNLLNPLGERPLDLLDCYEPRSIGDPDVNRIHKAFLDTGAREDIFTIIRIGDTVRLRKLIDENPALANVTSEDNSYMPLFAAARAGRLESARILLECGASVDALNNMRNTSLWFACQSPANSSDRIAVAKLLLEYGADINRRCEDGTTALHFAAWRGPAAMVEFLLSRGARNWIGDNKNELPLDYAKRSVSTDKEKIIALFSEIRILDPHFRMAVEAIDSGDVEELRRLLREHPILATQRAEEEGWFSGPYFRHPTLLHFVANNPHRQKTVVPNICKITQAIIDAGADVNAKTEAPTESGCYTTLGLVASSKPTRESGVQEALLALLIKNGADGSEGIGAGLWHGEPAAAEFLLKQGIKPDMVGAAGLGMKDELIHLLKQEKNISKDRLESALDTALKHNRWETVEVLLDAEIPLNEEILHAGTPLHHSALYGHKGLCQKLIEKGASLTMRDRQWNGTPADWAFHGGGYKELSEWLKKCVPPTEA